MLRVNGDEALLRAETGFCHHMATELVCTHFLRFLFHYVLLLLFASTKMSLNNGFIVHH